MLPVECDEILPVLGLEDDVVREQHPHGFAKPSSQNRISDALRFGLNHDLDGNWQLFICKVLVKLAFGRGHDHDGAFESGAHRFIERVNDQGFPA
jgi:hypothetical protein